VTIDAVGEEEALEFLRSAEMEVLGLLPYASNATMLARLSGGDRQALAVYKPRRGERPLWDFPSGTLCLREAATWVVSHVLGWDLVPPTVLRDGPAGYGALQWFIDENEEGDVRQLPQTHPDELRKLALLDAVINNADRKAGHLLVDRQGRLWGVDHGLCFNEDPKLRTVVWVYEGEPIPPDSLRDLETFSRVGLSSSKLDELLSPREMDALCERIGELLATGTFPEPDPGRHHVPWPPW
jgi:uncharacterized repeat protein (TIGR03843 family)